MIFITIRLIPFILVTIHSHIHTHSHTFTNSLPFSLYIYMIYDRIDSFGLTKKSFIRSVVGWYKNIEKHTAHTIVSWPNPKHWVIVHTFDSMMMIRQSIYIISIITKVMDKLKTRSPTYCMMDNWENMLNLTHTFDKLYLRGISMFNVQVQCLQINLHNDDNEMV